MLPKKKSSQWFVLITRGQASGWADLTSIVVYVYLLPVAVVLGILAEVILYFKNKKNHPDA